MRSSSYSNTSIDIYMEAMGNGCKDKLFASLQPFILSEGGSLNVSVSSNVLAMPSKFTDGYLRFCCPLCSEFVTATSSKTNLGRCFRCNKNFNTIDLVMMDKKLNFVDAVKFLQQYQH